MLSILKTSILCVSYLQLYFLFVLKISAKVGNIPFRNQDLSYAGVRQIAQSSFLFVFLCGFVALWLCGEKKNRPLSLQDSKNSQRS